MAQDFLGYGAEELVAGDRLTSGRSQEPGVELNVCLSAPSSWALSYSNFSKWGAQSDMLGVLLAARLVLTSVGVRA